ncbi:MAG: ABC transporter permease subunit, partial [Rhodospirillales bacterium]|nr:ABC transporter permease subunit [Rhodospirillales bacterium]
TFLVITYHVLRNVVSPVLVYASSLIGASIVLASGLSFLGLGVQPPTADWGLMLSSLRQSIYVQPWVCAMPGVAIVLTSMCFNFASEGVRAALDIKA